MHQQLRIVLVTATAFLAACSSVQKKADLAPPAASTKETPKPSLPAQDTQPTKSIDKIMCEQGGDKRTVVVEPKEAGCEVHYSKFGNSEMVASAVHTRAFCDEVKEKIRANLEAGQFTCK